MALAVGEGQVEGACLGQLQGLTLDCLVVSLRAGGTAPNAAGLWRVVRRANGEVQVVDPGGDMHGVQKAMK